MMRCPLPAQRPEQNGNPEFYTGLDVARQDLAALGSAIVRCNICDGQHYLRKAYFEGDEPGLQHFEGLESAPPFAIEVGVIISTTSFAESYIPQIYSKITGLNSSIALQVFGSIGSVGQKIIVLEALQSFLKDVLKELQSVTPRDHTKIDEAKTKERDLSGLIKRLRECMTLRDHYAHAKYNAGGYPASVSMLPFFGDFRKRREGVSLTLSDLQRDSDKILAHKMAIRAYLVGAN